MHRLIIILFCIIGIFGAMNTNNPVPLKVMVVALAAVIIVSNLQEL